MSFTPQKPRRSASPVAPGEETDYTVKQRGEGLYHYEEKKLYSCPAKCGYETNRKGSMWQHLWSDPDHRQDDRVNLMREFQIETKSVETEPYPCYGCDKQPFFRPRSLIEHFHSAHASQAQAYGNRLEVQLAAEIAAKDLSTRNRLNRTYTVQKRKNDFVSVVSKARLHKQQKADHENFMLEQQQALFAAHAAGSSSVPAPPIPLDPTQQRREPRFTLCRQPDCPKSFQTHEALEAHMYSNHPSTHPYTTRQTSSPKTCMIWDCYQTFETEAELIAHRNDRSHSPG